MKNKQAPFTFFTGIVPTCAHINKSIVCLGTGECGKSSFVRQFTTIENSDKIKIHSEHIQYAILQNLMNIVSFKQTNSKITGGDLEIVNKLNQMIEQYVDSHFEHKHLEHLLKESKLFIKLIENPIIRDIIDNYELYPQIHLTGNHQYFFSHFERILISPSYEPTIEDYCRMQKKTVGVVNCGSFEYKNYMINM